MIRVASYCRVSTDKDDQASSFAAQQRYFQEYIARRPDWVLYAVYADEGITGTSTKKRARFNRMMSDAYAGKFSLIVTKEVSRFSRNILDTIRYTRELKAIGVAVLFVTDGINTMDPDAELRLSIMASIAQEESRRTSARVIWGQTRQMERGVVFGRPLLGYDVQGGRLTIEPEGAEVVRRIFRQYAVEQKSTAEIARALTEAGCRTRRGSSIWTANAVAKLLHNEKYVGDLVQKKTYTPDFLTHDKRKNNGQVPFIRIQNHHPPIVSREVWDLAQQRLQKQNKHAGTGHSNRYVFSGKIKCGECGGVFVSRVRKGADGRPLRRWRCGTAVSGGTAACGVGRLVRDDDAMQMLQTALQSLQMDREAILTSVTDLALDAILMGEHMDDPAQLRQQLERTERKKAAALDAYLAGDITKEEMLAAKARCDAQQHTLRDRLSVAEQQSAQSQPLRAAVQAEVAATLNGETRSEVLGKTLLESLTVYKDGRMALRLSDLPMVFLFAGQADGIAD